MNKKLDKKINLEERLVCFIDILGFKDIIENFDKTNDVSIIEKIKFAFEESIKKIKNPIDPQAKEILNVKQENIDLLKKDFHFKTFSDNIIISITYNNDNFISRLHLITLFSNIFQYIMTCHGVYIRGGLSFGSYYHDDNIIFSNALVKAYSLESQLAIYPRIVIDKNILNLIKTYNYDKIASSGILTMIYFDWENVAFINPFNTTEAQAKEIEEHLDSIDLSGDSEINQIFDSLPYPLKANSLKPYQFLLSEYEKILADAKLKSVNQDYPESVRNKYIWLIEFHKWKYKNEPSMLNFKPFEI